MMCTFFGLIFLLVPLSADASISGLLYQRELFSPPWHVVIAVVAILEAFYIAKLLWDVRRLRRECTNALLGEGSQEAPSNQSELAALYSKALTGSLDRFSIGEVIQFLNSIRETGILDIVDDRVSAVHRLMVEDGEIIDAYNGDKRGEEAVKEIMQCEEGSFTFIRGDLPSNERVIEKPTMTLLMESFQQKDEFATIELEGNASS